MSFLWGYLWTSTSLPADTPLAPVAPLLTEKPKEKSFSPTKLIENHFELIREYGLHKDQYLKKVITQSSYQVKTGKDYWLPELSKCPKLQRFMQGSTN
ncbi:MAG: hypothetical protein Sylvanvirus14_13 [Sylvanvirus sp.]|uniref:Uncharacterized protein n=1 Tax=Sylvanvirus sp. TaxID=2487774 RepID=A0A3G5AIE4_9VIRU|nr:MAG: hypothetical protein Sylvanvirus14_13 [Sylvanvirus sp.]